jgi:hypothetical protein
MDTSFSVYARELAYWLIVQSPLLLVWLTGAVLALVFWRRHRYVSLLLLAAVIIAVGTMLLDGYARVWLVDYLVRENIGNPAAEGWRSAFTLSSWIRSVHFLIAAMYAVAWGLTLGAVFGWRVAARAPKTAPASEPAATVQPAH